MANANAKQCRTCKKTKPLGEFNLKAGSKYGVAARCRDCISGPLQKKTCGHCGSQFSGRNKATMCQECRCGRGAFAEPGLAINEPKNAEEEAELSAVIASRAAFVRSGWSESEYVKRAALRPTEYTTPEAEMPRVQL